MTRADFRIIVDFFLDFAITAGSILGGAMLQSGQATQPHQAVILLALIMGFVTASRRAQATINGQPREDLEQTVKQLVGQMRTVHAATAQTLPLPPEPAAIPVKVVKDSS